MSNRIDPHEDPRNLCPEFERGPSDGEPAYEPSIDGDGEPRGGWPEAPEFAQ